MNQSFTCNKIWVNCKEIWDLHFLQEHLAQCLSLQISHKVYPVHWTVGKFCWRKLLGARKSFWFLCWWRSAYPQIHTAKYMIQFFFNRTNTELSDLHLPKPNFFRNLHNFVLKDLEACCRPYIALRSLHAFCEALATFNFWWNLYEYDLFQVTIKIHIKLTNL